MNITKEMGRACLRELLEGGIEGDATLAIDELVGGVETPWPPMSHEEFHTALAMCAAIAGEKPNAC